jgi:hypothetical protein
VVGVLVGDEDGVETGGVFADGGEAGKGLLAAEAGIDEDAGVLGADKGGVAGAGASEDADFDDKRLPETPW